MGCFNLKKKYSLTYNGVTKPIVSENSIMFNYLSLLQTIKLFENTQELQKLERE